MTLVAVEFHDCVSDAAVRVGIQSGLQVDRRLPVPSKAHGDREPGSGRAARRCLVIGATGGGFKTAAVPAIELHRPSQLRLRPAADPDRDRSDGDWLHPQGSRLTDDIRRLRRGLGRVPMPIASSQSLHPCAVRADETAHRIVRIPRPAIRRPRPTKAAQPDR